MIKLLHAGSDFVAVAIKNGVGCCDVLLVHEDGMSCTLQTDLIGEAVEIVFGRKFGLLRTDDNKVVQLDDSCLL